MPKLRVAVLMGGNSAEREISLSTGRQVLQALDPARYEALAVDTATLSLTRQAKAVAGSSPAGQVEDRSLELLPASEALLRGESGPGKPDVVFIALHGPGGEDGTIQGFLETLGIPYTGSGVLSSAMCMDKAVAKAAMVQAGIPTPAWLQIRKGDLDELEVFTARVEQRVGFPCIVKPNCQGSTIGCTRVSELGGLPAAIESALRFDESALVERMIAGTEITIGLLGDEDPIALPIIEIVPKAGFYDYEAKYASGGSEHIIPARVSERVQRMATDYAIRAHQSLQCRGMSRVDFMVQDDQPWALEVNTIPGMTPTSLLPEAAREAGISFGALLDRIIESSIRNSARQENG